jgi:hypothetical protein
MQGHDTLANHYTINFLMMQHHKYSLNELNTMMPWEREIYITMLARHLEEEKKRREQQARK